MSKRILVTGGRGYIGSHMVNMLVKNGYRVSVVDNSRDSRNVISGVDYYEIDLAREDIFSLFFDYNFDAVIHFAAVSIVSESIKFPQLYYRNNVRGMLNLIEAMTDARVNNLILSSTAAVYGEGSTYETRELLQPINPYGHSKLMCEQLVKDSALNYTIFRYFNASGRDVEANLIENHFPETHLIPLVCNTLRPNTEPVSIKGIDYPTADGTCIRDYIHVNDICRAHLLALEKMFDTKVNKVYNLGTGVGNSVMDVVNMVEHVSKKIVRYKVEPRREGDPPVLVAKPGKIKEDLGWEPQHSLEQIIKDVLS